MMDLYDFVAEALEAVVPRGFGQDYHWRDVWEQECETFQHTLVAPTDVGAVRLGSCVGDETGWHYEQLPFTLEDAKQWGLELLEITEATPQHTLLPPTEQTRYLAYVRRQLAKLRTISDGLPSQRDMQWHIDRSRMLTASDLYKTLGSDNAWLGLLRAKLRQYAAIKRGEMPAFAAAAALDWGVCFEPVVTDTLQPHAIRQQFGDDAPVRIGEFGCIPHPQLPGFGASPDGIVVEGPRQVLGRMLEIKCPVSRKQDPQYIKFDYWVQMQSQMECCGLEECDFVEVWFRAVTPDEWAAETTKSKGVAQKIVDVGWVHRTEPVASVSELGEGLTVFSVAETRQWVCDRFSCRLVRRNREWFRAHRETFAEFVEELQSLMEHGDVDDNLLNEIEGRVPTNALDVVVQKLGEAAESAGDPPGTPCGDFDEVKNANARPSSFLFRNTHLSPAPPAEASDVKRIVVDTGLKENARSIFRR